MKQKVLIILAIIFLSAFTAEAGKPDSLALVNISHNSATLGWHEGNCQGVDYILSYREYQTAQAWDTVQVSFSTYATQIITNLSPTTTYEWKVRCGGSWELGPNFTTVTSPPCSLITTDSITNASCNNTLDGSISISTSNGIPPYSYLWSNGDTTQNLIAIEADSFSVITTDNTGCIDTSSFIVGFTGNKELQQTIGDFDPNPVESWTFSYDTLTIVNMGCQVRIRPDFIISHNSLPIDSGTINISWESPFGWIPLAYNINGNGDAYGYWSLGGDSTGADLTIGNITSVVIRVRLRPYNGQQPNLGTYTARWETFEVDSLGNKLQSLAPLDIVSLTLIDCSIFAVSNSSSVDISCYGFNNGTASINSISNGSGSYSYAWDNGDSTQTVSNLQAGNYSCTITDNNWTLCSAIGASFTINEPTLLTATVSASDVGCNGDSSGVAFIVPSGGTGGYTTTFSGSSQWNLQAGDYPFTVTDDNQCTFSDTITINEPPPITSNVSTTDVTSCSSQDGSIDLTVTGGFGGYSYLWSNNEITQDLTNLSGGNYSVTIFDLNNCTAFNSVTINDFINTLSVNSLVSPTNNGYNILCAGDSNGSIASNISGGSGNITYSWSDGQTSAVASNLIAGTYILTISDTLGCIATDSVTLIEPNPITSNYTTTNVSCYGINDGAAVVNFFGGATGSANGEINYILGWDTLSLPLYFPNTTFTTAALGVGVPAGIYIYSATDLNGCTHSDTITITEPDSLYTAYTLTDFNGYNVSCYGDNNATIDIQINGGTSPFDNYLNNILQAGTLSNNLFAGNYTDSIVDANGCIATNTIILNEPNQLNTSLTVNDVSCNGFCDGGITTSTSGGVSPYNYLWSPNGLTTQNPSNLCVGSYSLTITDTNSCTETITANIGEPSAISTLVDSTFNASIYGANDASIYISTNGGTGNLTIDWIGPNGFTSNSEDIDNLEAGFYFLTLTDSNLCTYFDTIEITQPSSLWMLLDNMAPISCFSSCDGAININVTGGDSVYTFSWIGPNGFTSTNEDITNICAGEYIVILSDSNTTLIDTFTIYQPQPLSSVLTSDTISCYNGQAAAEILVYGGSSPFQYNWSNGGTNYYTMLDANTHTVEVTDTNGCVLLDTITLVNPDSISIQATSSNVSCFGLQDAVVSINVTNGGTAPYLYSVNNGINNQPSSVFYNIGAGSYTYLVSDANGCSNEIHLTVNQPDSLFSSISSNNTSCYGECDGSAIASISGGTLPYVQDWGGATASALCAGFYNVTITDYNGCLISDAVTISEPNPIIINIWQNGTDLEATSGLITYQWYDDAGNAIAGATTNIFVPTIQGEYYVQVTDSNGCSINSYSILFLVDFVSEDTFSVNVYPNPTSGKLIIDSSEDFNSILVFNLLGKTVYTFNNTRINNTLTTIDLSYLQKGIYFIQIEVNQQYIKQRIILQ
jgi:hypothetical protein